jgi:subtilisin family serine protease
VVTKAADMAAATGMLVVSSAGNDGSNGWHFISAPADGDSVLAVGAVDSIGFKAGFSSFGPSFDGRIKPNLSAQGYLAAVVFPGGQVGRSNGTSFSCPILAGMATAFWQAFPYLTNMEVIKYLQQSASLAKNPNNELGFGIPNYNNAKFLVEQQFGTGNNINTYPNPLGKDQNLVLDFDDDGVNGLVQVKIFDRVGRLVDDITVQKKMRKPVSVKIDPQLNGGFYIMQIFYGSNVRTQRLIKLQ